MRVGQGFDVHPWSDDPENRLVLGGVEIPGHRGLDGHSDSDAIAHACTDAVLGAIGLGDIGQLFPDTDASLAGADSIGLLTEAMVAVRHAGWDVANIDCTIVLDEPKIAPIRPEMERNLAAAVGAPVAVKGKRTEGLSALADGVQCFAVALLYRSEQDRDPQLEDEER
ncbi:MAG: 2-C-methyl-D-erythritol 2,4-cyclodiphosphate synthase [Acidimicrobiales bacterium]